jgi:hypothetical protein
MSTEIKDPETERVVRDLARRLNVEPDEAVRRAAEAFGADVDEEREVDAIIAEVRRLRVADPRPIKELLADEEPR